MPEDLNFVRTSQLVVEVLEDCVKQTTRNRGNSSSIEVWKVRKQLGKGEFGEVHLHYCVHNEEKVRAVKRLVKRSNINYSRELEAAAVFSQRRYEGLFVQSFGWYETPQYIFLTMEYLPLGDLQSHMSRPLPESEVRQIIAQILEGLSFMHDLEFTHRDLKPANVLVQEKGPQWWVKLADFGISKRVQDSLAGLSTHVYTEGYVAPEVLFKDERYTKAVDIWSAGIVTFLLFTGDRAPFKSRPHLLQYWQHAVDLPVDRLRDQAISALGRKFVSGLLSPDPEIRLDIKDCLQHEWLNTLTTSDKSPAGPLLENHNNMIEEVSFARWTTVDESQSSFTTTTNPIDPQIASDKEKPGPSAELTPTKQSLPSLRPHAGTTSPDELATPNGSLPPKSFSTAKEPDFQGTKETKIVQSNHEQHLEEHRSRPVPLDDMYRQHPGRTAYQVQRSVNNTIEDVESTNQAPVTAHNNASDQKELVPPNNPSTGKQSDSPPRPHVRAVSDPEPAQTDSSLVLEPFGTAEILGRQEKQAIKSFHRDYEPEPDRQRSRPEEYDKITQVQHAPPNYALRNLINVHEDKTSPRAPVSIPVAAQFEVVEQGKEVFNINSQAVKAVAFSPDGERIALGSNDQTIVVWYISRREVIGRLNGHTDWVLGLSYSADGRFLASGSVDKTIILWDTKVSTMSKRLVGHDDMVTGVAFSSDSTMLVSASWDMTVRLWNVEAGTEVRRFRGHENHVLCVAISSDGRTIASGSSDRTTVLWNTASGNSTRELDFRNYSVTSVAFSPDGNTIATASGKLARLWDRHSGVELIRLSNNLDTISSVAFSPIHPWVATGSEHGTVSIWDIPTGQKIRQYRPHTTSVATVAFSPDGRILCSGSKGSTISLWRVSPREAATGTRGYRRWMRRARDLFDSSSEHPKDESTGTH